MDELLLTKRLHISGLQPSLTPADLERRLSSFGKVMAMDGFGARDSLGDHRKFGFVTMEISVKGLEKCLNALSGTTWKGAKLRIGEAKPDFRERLAHINAKPPPPVRQRRARTRNYGYPSPTLPLAPLSATAAASTPGWIVTPSGRVVRPMRMRPERPLEHMGSNLGALNGKNPGEKMKKRVKPPLVRARRRLIDPTKWDSVYLKGVFLDTVPVPLPTLKNALEPVKNNTEDEEDEEEDTSEASFNIVRREVKSSTHPPILGIQQSQETATAISTWVDEDVGSIDVRGEANAALAMLDKMFEGREDWNERESVDEIEHLQDLDPRGKEMCFDREDEVEVVSRELGQDGRTRSDKGKSKEKSRGEADRSGHEFEPEAETADVEMEHVGPSVGAETPATVRSASRANLKTLFAPREEASFSLLEHLDLAVDLELDDDILGITAPPDALQENQPEPSLPTPHVVHISAPMPTTKTHSRVALDSSQPLLFPPLDSLTPHRNGAPMCFLFPSATQVRGLHPLPPSITFTRSPQDTPESIRERWEKDKSALTHEWKKAWREARGSKRGRVGASGEVGGSW